MPIGVLLFWIDAAHFDERGVIDPRTRESAGENALGGVVAEEGRSGLWRAQRPTALSGFQLTVGPAG